MTFKDMENGLLIRIELLLDGIRRLCASNPQ